MSVLCDKCDYVFDRTVKVQDLVIERYQNVYGTRCPKCNYLIKSIYKLMFVEKHELQLEQIRNEFLSKMRKKIRGQINANSRKTC